MSLSLTIGPLTPAEINTAIAALTTAGIGLAPQNVAGIGGSPGVVLPPPAKPASTMPPMSGTSAPATVAALPPPPAAAPAAPANAKLQEVLKAMDAYARAGHQVAGARKVLGLLGLSRAQDANEEQLEWLAQAFANTGWAPQ